MIIQDSRLLSNPSSMAKSFVEEKSSLFTVSKSGSLQKVRKDLRVARKDPYRVEMGFAFLILKSVLSHRCRYFPKIPSLIQTKRKLTLMMLI